MQRLHHPGRKLIFIMKAAELEIFITVITSRLPEGPYIFTSAAKPDCFVRLEGNGKFAVLCYRDRIIARCKLINF